MRPIRVAAALAAAACVLPTMALAADGDFPFVDEKIQIRYEACHAIAGNQFTATGLVSQNDLTVNPNRSVQFGYRSVGTAEKSDAKGAKGEFTSVDLTLTISTLASGDPPVPIYGPTTITHPCKLKASVKQAGALGSARLSCKLGESLEAFPGLTPDLVDSIGEAYVNRQSTRVNAKTGKLSFRLNGERTPEGVPPLPPCPDPNAPPG